MSGSMKHFCGLAIILIYNAGETSRALLVHFWSTLQPCWKPLVNFYFAYLKKTLQSMTLPEKCAEGICGMKDRIYFKKNKPQQIRFDDTGYTGHE